MSFKPSVHGWPFPNALTPDPSALGLGAPPCPELGLGAGMCWAALDRYLAGIRVPRDVALPGPGDALHAELVRRHAAALSGLWPRVREWQALSDREIGFRSRAPWRWLRDELTAGQPVLLTILLDADPYRRARAAAHVLATGCSVIDDQVVLSIYDPAHPGSDAMHLGFSLVGPPDARLSGGSPIRGFFPVPYDRVRPAGEQLEPVDARPVHGGLAVAAGGTGLELAARSPEGGLLHFHRGRRGRWQAEVVMEPDGSGMDELQGDPAVVITNGRVHLFARSYIGDLLHFQNGARWAATNLTAHEDTGPRFRLVGQPVPMADPNGGLSVFGRDPGGGIVQYTGTRRGRWTARRLPGDPITGDPLAARLGESLHLFGVDGDGRVIHRQRDDEEWESREIGAAGSGSAAIRLTGMPVPLVRAETVYLFGRDVDGRLVHFRRSPTGDWHPVTHPVHIAGAPAVVTGPGGIHLFAAGADGGLVHRWGETVWHGEDLAGSRPGLDLPGHPAAELHAWGCDEEMRVFGQWGGELMVLTWREDADWTAAALRDRAGIDAAHIAARPLVMAVDARGLPHLFGTDDRNAIVHVEQGPWIEPAAALTGDIEGEPAPPTEPEPAAEPEPATAPEPEPEPTTEPVMAMEPEAAIDPAPGAEPEPAPEKAEEAEKALKKSPPSSDGPAPVHPIPEVEPMDLSLLDTWPEPPPTRRKGQDDRRV